MGRIIALTNQKGGTGKTTVSVNLSVGLAKHKFKVLLIDLDPQHNATLSLGIDQTEEKNIRNNGCFKKR